MRGLQSVVLVSLLGCGDADQPPGDWLLVDPQPHEALEALLEAEMDADELVGLVAAVTEGSQVVYLEGFGWADREEATPMDPTTSLIRWASLSKGLTAWLALTEVERGLDLDASVTGTVPGYSVPDLILPPDCYSADCAVPIAADITLRQLLNHSAGIQHYDNGVGNPSPPNAQADDPEVNTGIAWAVSLFADAPLVKAPGTTFSYSTFGYNLAGLALEERSGLPFAALAEERLRSLGFETLQPDYSWAELPERAAGYHLAEGEIRRTPHHDVSWKLPGGGFLSTGLDLARWCAALATRRGLRPESYEALFTPTVSGSSYGLGFYVFELDAGAVIQHTGSQPKAKTALLLDESTDRCFVVMSNSRYADPGPLVLEMAAQF